MLIAFNTHGNMTYCTRRQSCDATTNASNSSKRRKVFSQVHLARDLPTQGQTPAPARLQPGDAQSPSRDNLATPSKCHALQLARHCCAPFFGNLFGELWIQNQGKSLSQQLDGMGPSRKAFIQSLLKIVQGIHTKKIAKTVHSYFYGHTLFQHFAIFSGYYVAKENWLFVQALEPGSG